MRFVLIDRILEVESSRCRLSGTQTLHGQAPRLTAVKNLSLAEEYLSDHFPGFPVMPGVLMLEALTQAGAWLVRELEDFASSIIVLKQARTIKYGSFVEPGRQLELKVELTSYDPQDCVFKGVGDDRRPGDGQGPFHLDTIQLTRSQPGSARDRRVDRRRPARPVCDPEEGFRRCPRHRASAGCLPR